jgi:hypothetical protein
VRRSIILEQNLNPIRLPVLGWKEYLIQFTKKTKILKKIALFTYGHSKI